ncbi:MAG: sigma-70 family RNA polymerase sigma factor [bacterium]
MQPTDAELLKLTRRGDEQAFDALISRYRLLLYRTAAAMVGNSADAEDVFQETAIAVYRGAAGFGWRSSVKTWLIRILIRQASRLLAKRGQEKKRRLEAGGRSEEYYPNEAKAADIGADIAWALQGLSTEYRTVIVLRELNGLSYGEIAEMLNVPKGTVESRIYRARQELKVMLKDYIG